MKNLKIFKSGFYEKLKLLIIPMMLLTIGVGQMWGGTRRIYFDKSNVTWWNNDSHKSCVYAWNDDGNTKYEMTNITSTNIYYADINDAYPTIIFYRSTSINGGWTNQSVDITIDGYKNYFKIKNDEDNGKKKLDFQSFYLEDAYLYFDKSNCTSWGTGSNHVIFTIGRYDYTDDGYTMTNITNTNLYQCRIQNWTNYDRYRFVNTTSYGKHNSGMEETPSVDGYTAITSGSDNSAVAFDYESHNLYTFNGTNGTATTKTVCADYSDLDRTITIKEKYNSTGAGTYLEITNSYQGETYGSISATGKKFDSWTTCAGNSSTSLTKESTSVFSSNADFGYTSTVRLTASATKAGKAFVGWYTSGGSLISSNTTYDYTVTGDATIYAYYKDEETHDITISYKCGDDVIKTAVVESAVGVTTTRSVTAPTIDHYEFTGWTYGTGVTSASWASSTVSINSVTGQASGQYILTANYKKLTRFYFVNTGGWSKVYAYMWGDGEGNNSGLRSNEITSKTKDFCGTNVYYFDRDASSDTWNKIIFHNGLSGEDEKKTGDLTATDNEDKMYILSKTDWYNVENHTVSVATAADHMGTVSGGGTAKAYGCSAAISASAKPGYRFSSWSVTSGTAVIDNASSASTTVTASTDATITASFTQDGFIYFDNTMSQWHGDIYVYFFTNAGKNPWWKNKNGNNGPGVVINEDGYGNLYAHYGKMTRIGDSNIYFYDYASASLSGSSIEHVVFTKGDYHTSHGLYQTSAAFRSDFKNVYDCFPMYIASQSWTTTNETGYHDAGYWKRYNVTESGFWLIGLKDGNSDGDYWDRPEDELAFTATSPNSNTFKAKVHLNNATWNFRVTRCYGSDLANTGTMTASNHSGWEMTATGGDCHIEIPAGGDYEFTLNLGSDHIYLSVEYPLLQNDYHLLYTGRIETTGSDSHVHDSQPIRHLTAASSEQRDTVSFFIDKDHKGTLQLQRCTDPSTNSGKGTWADTLSALDLSAITETGIYNFEIVQTTNASGVRTASASILDSDHRRYTGPLYIRTDVADGGWEAYKEVENNQMVFSDYAKSHSGYDYYHTHYAPTGKNLHFTIANDYSPSISDTMKTGPASPFDFASLPYQASVRFMYHSATNILSRAYLNGSSESGDATYLILRCNGDSIRSTADEAITNISGSLRDTTFKDLGNWVYQLDVEALEGTHVRLISNYYFSGTPHHQYFKGSNAGTWTSASTEQIIGGTAGTWQNLRLVYDFKTNNLVSAWMPPTSGNTPDLALYADVMILREEQKDARQITFASGHKLTEVDTVYAVMQFNKWSLNNRNKANTADSIRTVAQRNIYWISFPFDVKLNDVFGFGTYGTHWGIEYYDGKARAQQGYWADSEGFWKLVTPEGRDTFELKANTGYLLVLDLDLMGTSSKVWEYVEDVFLYFPSKFKVGSIESTNKKVTIDQNGYLCEIDRRSDADKVGNVANINKDRRIADSYWHCIGVPSYANNTRSSMPTEEPNDPEWPTSLPYLYVWDGSTSTYTVNSSSSVNFKATYSYLVQYSGEDITWTSVSATPGIMARQRKPADFDIRLELLKNGQQEDQTFVRLTEDANVTADFEFNYDLFKEMNGRKGNIYTMISGYIPSAGNMMPFSESTTTIPVGVKIAIAGDYTFAIPEGTNGVGVILVDNVANTRTNLGLNDYTVSLGSGQIDGRFSLEISPISQSPTNIELINGENGANGVSKKLIDGVLYIVKDGQVFDARGNRVK